MLWGMLDLFWKWLKEMRQLVKLSRSLYINTKKLSESYLNNISKDLPNHRFTCISQTPKTRCKGNTCSLQNLNAPTMFEAFNQAFSKHVLYCNVFSYIHISYAGSILLRPVRSFFFSTKLYCSSVYYAFIERKQAVNQSLAWRVYLEKLDHAENNVRMNGRTLLCP